MGAIDAASMADFVQSLFGTAVTSSTDGSAVDVTDSRGEAAVVDVPTVNTNGDLQIRVMEKDPGGSFSAVADEDLDFSGSQLSTNNGTITGLSSATKEVIRYTGNAAELRVDLTTVGGDIDVVAGILKHPPRRIPFN